MFHIHQIQLLLTHINGVPLPQATFRDVIQIPQWSGKVTDPYPNVTLRVDFRSPTLTGVFPYHCHIVSHQDKGMMAKIQVLPAPLTSAPSSGQNAPSLSSSSSSSSSSTVNLFFVIPSLAVIILVLSLYICLRMGRKQTIPPAIVDEENTLQDSLLE